MAREVRNCKRCGKIFVYAGVPFCPECLAKEEEQFRTVKRYLDEHPGAGVQETSDETKVPVDIVVEFLRQGLLVTASGSAGQLTCMICKKPITRGRLCPKCEAALAVKARWGQELGADGARNKASQGQDRFYTMDSIGRRKS